MMIDPSVSEMSNVSGVGVLDDRLQQILREKSTLQFKRLISKSVKLPAEAIEADISFDEYGIDSFLVMELTHALGDVFGVDNISTTLLFEYQNIESLVDYFMQTQADALMRWTGVDGRTASAQSVETAADRVVPTPRAMPVQAAPAALTATRVEAVIPPRPLPAPTPALDNASRFRMQENATSAPPTPITKPVRTPFDVAIIGLSGRYPGAADVAQFWDNLAAGRNSISQVPLERWDHSQFYDEKKPQIGKTYTRWAGFLDDVDCFDRLFFNMTTHDAQQMSPQERLFLQEAYASIEDAGYTPENLCASRKIGSFVGVVNEHYATGVRFWSIANRVSYLFNFQGPSMAVDTACSSSLTALHLAVESLRAGDSDVVIVGGVNLITAPAHLIDLSSLTMLSSGDKCKAFAADGDGFVDSEAVGAMVLKPLYQAVADGDHIYGVIKGSAVNAGGKTHGYTVPNPTMQAQVVSEALRRAGIDARSVSYVEAHGTGTSLGDPIEIAGLSKAFRHWTRDTQYCAIGSVKSNVGHTESAAGFVGVSKVLMQLKHRMLAPSLHAAKINPNIKFADTPFVLQQELGPWLRPMLEIDGRLCERPRIAGISSFGAGGANAHVVIEEYIAPLANRASAEAGAGPAMIVLSARTEERLIEQARRLLAAISSSGVDADVTLANVAYTLQVGREAMEERLALRVDSFDDLRLKLTAVINGHDDIESVYRGHAKRKAMSMLSGDEDMNLTVQAWVAKGKFDKLLELWVRGFTFDWNVLYESASEIDRPRRISLPTYPFVRERYWTDVAYPEAPHVVAAPGQGSFFAQANPASSAPPVAVLSNESTASPAIEPNAVIQRAALPPSVQHAEALAPASAVAASSKPDTTAVPAKAAAIHHSDVLLTMWQELFGRPALAEDDNFFDLGGDSLLGMQLVSRIRAEFGIEVEMNLIFEAPTVKSLAARIKWPAAVSQAPNVAVIASPAIPADTSSTREPLERQLSYWKQQLAGSPSLLTLPTDRPRPAQLSQRGSSVAYSVAPALVSALQGLSRQTQSTLLMTLGAAFNVLLARYSGQSDICVGTPLSHSNALVLRTQVDLRLDFNTLLQQVRRNTLDAYAHQDVPFEQLVEALRLERHASYAPLFQVLLTLQNASIDKLSWQGAQLDLALNLTDEGPNGLQGCFEYSTDLFDASTVARMGEHFTHLLQAIVADPHRAVGELPMLGDAERQQLLHSFNDTATVYPKVQAHTQTLQQLFEVQAARTPEQVAVIYEGASLSYAQLDAQANRLARHLRTLGVGPDSLVGVCAERSIAMIVALYAILKAGGAYVPLDPTYPSDRLATILADARPVVVLTQAHTHDAVAFDVPLFCLDRNNELLHAYESGPLAHTTQANHLAYVIYTSGSTGKPKGVGIEHRGIVNRLQWMQAAYPLTASDRVLQKTPFSFDVSVWEFFWPLLEGATLVVAKPEGHQDVSYLAELIDAQAITTLHFVPPMLEVFLNESGAQCGGSLRQVMCSGQALPLELQQRFFAKWDHVALHNLYGPTEASVDVTFWECRKDSPLSCVPIGRPIANIQIHILDDLLNPVPVGVIGHLYIAGIGLARGYLNRPELTAQTFIPNPFSSEPGARMYLSGDLARYLPDGTIEYLGRSDHQVKIRGLRIELGEIESTLASLDAVRDVVVLAREDSAGDQRLVAYLVAYEGQGMPEAAQLRAILLQTLPEYMVPSYFITLAQLPLTANGKVDRKALPAPDLAQSEAAYVAPRTPTEEIMAGLWADLLKREKVGIHDDFFALGGHSLQATQLMSRLRSALHVELPLRTLFDAPTIASLMLKVAVADNGASAPPLIPVDRAAALPLSFAQARLWFLDQLEPDAAIYTIPSAFRLSGHLDVGALARTLNEIVRRHEALRTSFVMVDDEPVQIIAPTLALPLPLTDLSPLPSAERERQLRLRVQDDVSDPFDLATGPLIRFSLIRLDENEHVLLLTMHHIVSDGWSVGVLMRELATLYRSFTQGLPSPLADLPIHYADFAQWQRQWLSEDILAPQLRYWTQQLGDSPSLFALPTDRPRPARMSHAGANLWFELPAPLVAGLQTLGRQTQSTLFMTLCAVFNVLLARYSGQSDICIGTPIANRNRSEIEDLIGFFVNTLVLRTQLDLKHDFIALQQQVKQCALNAYANQDVPFEQLVDALRVKRHTNYTPLFQVMLVLQNAPADALDLPGLSIETVHSESVTAKFDLTLILTESNNSLNGCFEFSTELFDAPTIARMAQHFIHLLHAVVADPHSAVGELAMLDNAERQQLLHVFSHSAAAYPSRAARSAGLCIHQRFERLAQQTPAAPAVIDGDQRYSYAQLNRQANRLAHLLSRRGVRDGDTVAIALPRGIDLIVAELAVVKAGAAYVPLDTILPLDRQTHMLRDCGARCVITHSGIDAPDIARRLELDHADTLVELEQQPEHNLPTVIDGAACAYIMYTSGSTGQSKGVQIPHRAIERLAIDNGYLALQADDRFACAANPAFDASTLEIWVPLQTGAAIVIVSQNELMEPDRLARLIREQHVTGMWMTVGLFNQYALTLGSVISELRALIVGGDVLDPHIIGQVLQSHPPQRLINGYGPTETTTFAATYDITQVVPGRSIPIGRPIGNTCIYVLDTNLQPVPIGVAGELYIGGAGVALGYINLPALTQERFIADPFAPVDQPGARLYKTGDLGRYLPDGNIEFLGRNDFQVKIRGFRIELGEIEAKLKVLPQVRDALVLAREDHGGDKRLVAYLVAYEGQGVPDATQLRTILLQTLPEYMVPSYFITLERLPLTANGKVDRKALPAPDMTRSEEGYVAPRTPAEEIMAGLWAEVLKLDKVGIHDDFFALGGHSLLATQLISRIRRSALQAELPLRALFEAPTVAALMLKVGEADNQVSVSRIMRIDRNAPLPLSFAQTRLWFLDQLQRDNAFYNIPSAVRLTGRLEVGALERTLNEVLRRHEALRTLFAVVDDEPVQIIAPELTLPLPIIELSHLSAAEREVQVRLRLQQEVAKPFDLAVGPLIRFTLMRLDEQEHVLFFTMHHIVSDGWSMGIVAREVAVLYWSFTQGQPSPLAELPIQYADFAHWQRQWLRGSVLERQLDYWKQQLAGSPSLLTLPTDRPRPAQLSQRGSSVAYSVAPALVSALQALSRQTQSTLFMTLCAAFNVLLARYCGQHDICIGTPIANRNRSEVEDLVGFFVNTLVLRTQVDPSLDFSTLLQQVRRNTLDAYAHQDVPFEQLVEALRPERHASYTPLFQVLLVLQNTPMTKLSLPGLQLDLVPSESVTTHFDLALNLTDEGPNGLQGCFEYSTDLFDAATVARMGEHFTHLLQAIVADPHRAVGELPMLGETERQQLLYGFNDTATVYPQAHTQTLQQLFEVQAARTPEQVAVIYEGASLSYAQLDAQANRLARHLRTLGVGPDTLVGLCAERSIAMIVALYAILKAGGAYVPLDPTYPSDRLATILANARPVVVLTQAHTHDAVAFDVPLFCLDRNEELLNRYASGPLDHHTQANHLAYVIYTSGSTGKPKGVGIEHRGIVNRLQWMQAAYPLTASDRVLQKTPFSFDVSVWEFFWPLLEGATLVVAKPEGHQDVSYLAGLIDAQAITTLHFVPPMLEVFLNESGAQCGGSLRQVMCSGQALPLELQQRFFAKWDHVALHNLYGPTEASVDVTFWECRKDSPLSCVPIGRPIANIQIHILDELLNPVPVGVIGHLYIAGIGLARGYLNRPELTAQTFIPNPFSSEPGARMYLSGDLARYLPDGTIEYLGRSDHQVKIRGLRIELGEIESTLASLDAVRDVVVLAREDSAGDQRLVAYLVAYEGQGLPEAAQLRAILLQTLPEYMVPSYFITLAQLPLTANGKVDRKALPAPDIAQSEAAYVAPRTPTEEIIAAIWADVLHVERIGVHDEFFALGGHSMLAVQLVSQLRKRAAIDIQLRNLFSHPTLGALAAFVDSSKTVSRHPNLVPIRPQGGLTPLFLIHPVGGEVQYAFDLAQHLEPDQPVYALAASGLAVGETPRNSIVEMADVYMRAIRDVQASGPYTLAGWSLGGMIAYEIAHQLLEAGETVNFVGMIDTGSSPFLRTLWRANSVEAFDECKAFLTWIVDQHAAVADVRQHAAYAELTVLAERRDIDAMLAVCQREALLPAHLDMAFVKQIFAVHLAGAQAAIEYEAPVTAATVILLTADHPDADDATLGWRDLLGESLHVTRIGGSHMSIVKPPYLEKLAREMSSRIKQFCACNELSYVD